MKLPAYPRYKPSGVEWLGDVPEHWETKKVTCGFSRIGSGTTPKSDSDDFYDGDVPWVTTSELRETVITKTKESVTRAALAAHSALRLYPTGTLLFAMYGATIGRLGILGTPATLNQACCAFAAPTLFDTQFVFYWLWMRRPILISLSTGGGQPNLSQDDLRQIRISTPPLAEQRSIAAFLNRETGRVDRLVAKKRELIERLKEKRTALISRTVTRGLPPAAARAAGLPENPPLKPSGLNWLGDIPKHWEVVPLFRIVETIQTGPFGSQLHSADYVEGGVPLINPAHIIASRLVPDEMSAVDESTAVRLSRHRLREGDIIMARRGEIGRCGVVGAQEAGWLCGTGSLVIRLRDCNASYFATIISGAGFSGLLELHAVGTTMLNLNPTIVGRMLVPVPPLPEQAAIAAYLDMETAKLDALVGKVEEAVERLQEYRTALITAAVTGKIDVRSLVATRVDEQVTSRSS